jgi:hypothetical protein
LASVKEIRFDIASYPYCVVPDRASVMVAKRP